ncbi:hypothetical protein I552_1316 [Mycobacterium xenopi 3993]|nr:hypothetical protein I552_1316 [Mycobacterium xenopi 3993]
MPWWISVWRLGDAARNRDAAGRQRGQIARERNLLGERHRQERHVGQADLGVGQQLRRPRRRGGRGRPGNTDVIPGQRPLSQEAPTLRPGEGGRAGNGRRSGCGTWIAALASGGGVGVSVGCR